MGTYQLWLPVTRGSSIREIRLTSVKLWLKPSHMSSTSTLVLVSFMNRGSSHVRVVMVLFSLSEVISKDFARTISFEPNLQNLFTGKFVQCGSETHTLMSLWLIMLLCLKTTVGSTLYMNETDLYQIVKVWGLKNLSLSLTWTKYSDPAQADWIWHFNLDGLKNIVGRGSN